MAVVKVMSPIWLLSPTVNVPVAVVWIRASSASVRLTLFRALLVPPRFMGRPGTDEPITTPPAVGAPRNARNLLTVSLE